MTAMHSSLHGSEIYYFKTKSNKMSEIFSSEEMKTIRTRSVFKKKFIFIYAKSWWPSI